MSALAEVGWNQVVLVFLAPSLTEVLQTSKKAPGTILYPQTFFDPDCLNPGQTRSGMLTPEPPISFGRSFIFGSPSCIRSFVSS